MMANFMSWLRRNWLITLGIVLVAALIYLAPKEPEQPLPPL
jgi:uncharacterized membrane protein